MKVVKHRRRSKIGRMYDAFVYPNQSAAVFLSLCQKILLLMILAGAVAIVKYDGWQLLARVAFAVIVAFYVILVGFKGLLWWASRRHRYIDYKMPDISDPNLPSCTIMVTLMGEQVIVSQLIEAIKLIIYPPEKLEVMIVVEDERVDPHTAPAVKKVLDKRNELGIFKVQSVPHDLQLPQNKPRALVWGHMHANPDSDILVIYDAEDHPEPNQLLKAVGMLRAAKAQGLNVGCVQARLAFWNPGVSFISKCYDAEYFVHFKWMLPGLAHLGLVPPLGGTSNIFRRETLAAIAASNPEWAEILYEDELIGNIQSIPVQGAHDPYNITEDASIGMSSYKVGYSIAMLDSVTYEESQISWRGARRQRSRWLQGYMQTFFVHTRRPLRTIHSMGWWRGFAQYFSFNLTMLGAPLSYLLSPIVWGTMLLYIGSRLKHAPAISSYIEHLFPAPVYFPGMLVFLIGNFVLLYQIILAPVIQQDEAEKAAKPAFAENILESNRQQEEYGLVFPLLFIPLFWMFTSSSAYRALRKLLTPSLRSHWDLTKHGHAREQLAELQQQAALSLVREEDIA